MQNEFGYDSIVHFEHHYGDILENPYSAERSEWYEITSHPHVRFDGMSPVIGALNCLDAGARYRSRINDRIAETEGLSPVEITGWYELAPTEVSLSATYRLTDPVILSDLRASFLIYEDNVYWCCGYNGVSVWQHVTRVIQDDFIVLENVGDAVTVTGTIPLDPSWNPGELHMIAYLQDSGTFEIIQGLILNPLAAGVDPALAGGYTTGLAGAIPNPVLSRTAITFNLSPEAASGPVALEILDPSGRKITELLRGIAEPGPHTIEWIPGSHPSGPFPGGLYLARLSSREGNRSIKLTVLR